MLWLWLCAVYLVYFLWCRFGRRTRYDGPKALTWCIITSLKEFLAADDIWKILLFVADLCKANGEATYVYIGFHKVYLISNPEDCQTVMETCPVKDPYIYRLLQPWIGHGVVTAEGMQAKIHRKHVAKTMTAPRFDEFLKAFNTQSKKFVKKMAPFVNKGPIDIEVPLAIYNLEQVCLTFFSLNNVDQLNWEKYLYGRKEFFKILSARVMRIHLSYDYIYNFSQLKKKEVEMVNNVQEIIYEILDIYQRELEETSAQKGITVDELKKTFGEEYYINSLQKAFSHQDLIEQLSTALLGAHDSSTLTTLYALIQLGSHPDIQEKAYNEVQEVLGDRIDEDITREDLSKLVYLEAIIKEITRLYPYLPLIPKYIDKDTKLQNCTLGGGASCMVVAYTAHRHPSWGADVDEFRPERFLEDRKLPPYFGFSAGPRACMGKRYAMWSLKTMLARLLHAYKVKADHTLLTHSYTGVLEAKSGHHVEFLPRTR